jgi:hypothetical protein
MLPSPIRIDGGAVRLVEIDFCGPADISEVDVNRHGAKRESDQAIRLHLRELAPMREVVDVGPMVAIACLNLLIRPSRSAICANVCRSVNEERLEASSR